MGVKICHLTQTSGVTVLRWKTCTIEHVDFSLVFQFVNVVCRQLPATTDHYRSFHTNNEHGVSTSAQDERYVEIF
jgi:hypothetical protein